MAPGAQQFDTHDGLTKHHATFTRRGVLTLAAVLNARGDEVAEHYVQLARSSGHSWTAIGERLGVSKQAARERFGVRFDLLSASRDLPPTVRLGACMEAAEVAADGSPIRTDHQLLGLFQDGVGAAILERLGLTRDAVRIAAAELDAEIAGPGNGLGDGEEARRTIERASHLARQAGHNYLCENCVRLAQDVIVDQPNG